MLKKVGEIWTENKKDDIRIISLLEKAGFTVCYVEEYGSDGSEYMFMEEKD